MGKFDMQTINERIAKLRESKSMKQKDFSEAIGFPRSSLSEIENGKRCPPVELIVCISTKFHEVNVDWLLTGEGDMYRHVPQATDNPKIQKMQELMDGLSENQQQEIFLAVAEKKRLNQLEMLISDMSKGARKPNPAEITAELKMTA